MKGKCGENCGYDKFGFRPAMVVKSVRESPRVLSLYLKTNGIDAPEPGQFVMVWLPGAEDLPMSISGLDVDIVRISVAKAGETTSMMHALRKGDNLFLRGPFGNGFSIKGKRFLFVAGGYGAAPLIYAAKRISQSRGKGTYIVGAKTRAELLFLREAERLGMKTVTATEDGSAGFRGMVTNLLPETLEKEKFDRVLTCGPDKMMYEVVRECVKRGIPVEASLERYMKCGFGICGSCVIDPIGSRVCVEGPVFDGALLLATDFGKWKRDECGCRVRV